MAGPPENAPEIAGKALEDLAQPAQEKAAAVGRRAEQDRLHRFQQQLEQGPLSTRRPPSAALGQISAAPPASGEIPQRQNQAAAAPPRETGLASLDIQLPNRGVEYLFTTPRGDVEIRAHAIGLPLLERLSRLGWTVGLIVVVAGLYRLAGPGRLDAIIGRGRALLLIAAGIVLLILGLVPLLALAAIGVGLVQRLRPVLDAS